MGAERKRKPLELHVIDPKARRSKEQLEAKADAEIAMGEVKFTAPAEVKRDKIAFAKWREIVKIYKDSGLTLVTSTDNGVLARYCMLHSEYINLVDQRLALSNFELPADDTKEIMAISEEEYSRERATRLWDIMDYFSSLDGLLKLDDKINRKCDAILKIEDRIFLNPAAKVRTLPIKKRPKEKSELGDLGFDV